MHNESHKRERLFFKEGAHPSLRDTPRLAFLLALALVVAFAPFVFGASSLMLSAHAVSSLYPHGAAAHASAPYTANVLDMVGGWLTEPWLGTEHRFIWSLQTPLWDRFDGYGNPLAATMQPGSLSPFTILFGIPRPSPLVFDLFCLARLFAAGLGAALFVRLFAGFLPALAAGIAAEFGGYYMGFLTQPHLSVEVMVPGVLFATELAVRRPGVLSTAFLAAMTGSMYLGGMPESAFLIACCGAAYAVFRVATSGRSGAGARLASLAGGNLLGAALAAAVIVPFVQLMPHSSDIHQTGMDNARRLGLLHDTELWHALMTEFVPLGYGTPWHDLAPSAFSSFPALRGYIGIVTAFLAAIAVAASGARAWQRRWDARDHATLFLALVVLVCFGKRMGAVPLQWIGNLPLLQLVILEKYLEPIMNSGAALLAGFGLAAVIERRAGARATAAAFAAVLLALSYAYLHHEPAPNPVDVRSFYDAMALALAALGVAGAVLYLAAKGVLAPGRASWFVVGTLFVELVLAYPLPTFLLLNGTQSPSLNAYAGVPYVDFLQKSTRDDAMRVFGTAGTLFPNWAGSFGLYDPAQHNAMYLREYVRFMNAFGVADPPTRLFDADRYTGSRVLDLGTRLRRRWLALSSVRYVVTPRGHDEIIGGNEILDALWSQNYSHVHDDSHGVRLTTATLGGRTIEAMVEQPTRGDLLATIHVPAAQPVLTVELGAMRDAVVDDVPVEACSAPVVFHLNVETPEGRRLPGLSARIDPRAANGWTRRVVDLRAARGRDVRMTFGTQSPAGAACRPQAVWGGPRFGAATAAGAFRSAFADPDVQVYRYDDALARVTAFHDVRAVPTSDAALRELTGPSFDERRTAVVVGPPETAAAAPATGPDRLRLVRASNGSVTIEADLTSAAVVMLNDAMYTGWEVRVDGAPRAVLQTDYLFRGVAVPAGRHTIAFSYRSPIVRLSVAVSVAALAACAVLVALGLGFPRALLRLRAPAAAVAKRDPV